MRYVEYHKNGPVISIGVQVAHLGTVQLDFIKINPKLEINALAYYAYNDLGNLMGRIAAARGFKYGPEGLSYRQYASDNPSRFIGEVVVTTDIAMIFEFLGWRYYDWAEIHSSGGFKDLNHIFEWVYNNPYLTPAMFDLSERRSADRRRDAKRATYTKFLNFLQRHPTKLTIFVNYDEVEYARQCFPLFDKALSDNEAKYQENKVRAKIDGDFVYNWTGLEGKELGKFMKYLKNAITNEMLTSLEGWEVRNLVESHYDTYNTD
jgi:hypothetical protein